MRSCRAESAFACPCSYAARVRHSAKGDNAQVLLCRSEPAIGSRKRTSPGGLITLLRGHFVRPTRGMFVILNEVKNLDLHAIRSFAGAQDDKLRSCMSKWRSPTLAATLRGFATPPKQTITLFSGVGVSPQQAQEKQTSPGGLIPTYEGYVCHSERSEES